MYEGFAIGRAVEGLSNFARGWTRTKMALDAQTSAEERWKKEFFLKQDEAMRRNLIADRRWRFEIEQWHAGEKLRKIKEESASLNLDALKRQFLKAKKSDIETPMALSDFSRNWNKIYVKGDPEQTKVNYVGYFTNLASKFPDADVRMIERLDKMFRNSGVMSRGKASKLVPVVRDGKKYTQVIDGSGNVLNTIAVGKYSDDVVKILEGVEDRQKREFDKAVELFNLTISAKNSANKGLLMFSSGVKESDDRKAWKGLLKMKSNLEQEIANSYSNLREELSKQLAPFTDKDTREKLLDARLGHKYEMTKPRSIEFYTNEFEKTINQSLANAEGTLSPRDVIFALESRVANNLEGDDLDAALDALQKMEVLYTGEVYQEPNLPSIKESELPSDDLSMENALQNFGDGGM